MTSNIRGTVRGMGPTKFQKDKWLKCSEFFVTDCSGELPECCKAIPCKVCIEFEIYGEPTVRGVMEWKGESNRYEGTLGNFVVYGQWSTYPDCKFDIYFDDVLKLELLQCSNYKVPFDCRNMASESPLTLNFDDGTFKTYALVPFEVARITNYGGQCESTLFCNNCTCAPKLLCATLVTCDCYRVQLLDFTGTLCPETSKVDELTWYGEFLCLPNDPLKIIQFSISRDAYTGDCVYNASVDGSVLTSVPHPDGCGGVNVSYQWDGPISTEYLIIQAVGSCDESCASNQCWEIARDCVLVAPKRPCCDEVPNFWHPFPGWFDADRCDRNSAVCNVPPDELMVPFPCDNTAICSYGSPGWTLYVDGQNTYMVDWNNPYGYKYRYVVRDNFPWENLCSNVLFRDSLCDPYVDQCEDACPVDFICLSPSNACLCDIYGGRPEAMPRIIPVTGTTNNGSGSGNAVWEPSLGGWLVTNLEILGGYIPFTVTVLLRCPASINGLSAGDISYYLYHWSAPGGYGNASFVPGDWVAETTYDSCYPFSRSWIGTFMYEENPLNSDALQLRFLEAL